MKREIIMVVILLCLVGSAFGAIEAEHKCVSNQCYADDPVTFIIQVFNNLNKTIEVREFLIIESDSSGILSRVNDTRVIGSREYLNLTVETLLKMPESGYTYFYNPCINVAFAGTNVSKYVCGDIRKSITLTPAEKRGCRESSDCLAKEMCHPTRFKCENLECNEGETIIDHECVPFTCSIGEVMVNGSCVKGTDSQDNKSDNTTTVPSNGANTGGSTGDGSTQQNYLLWGVIGLGVIVLLVVLYLLLRGDKVIIYRGDEKEVKRR